MSAVLAVLLLTLAATEPREAQLARAQVLARGGDYAGAAALYRARLQEAPADGEAALGLAQVTAWSGAHAEALAQLDALLAREPGNGDALLLRARVLLWLGRPAEGLETLARRGGAGQDPETEALREQLLHAKEEDTRWELRVGYTPEHYSFTSMGHGAGALLSYGERGRWSVRAGGGVLRRFGQVDGSARAGGSMRVGGGLTLSADVELAPGAQVLPRQAYSAEGALALGRFTPSLSYRYADYPEADVHTLSPSLGVALTHRLSLGLRYALGVDLLSGDTVLTHSGLARMDYTFSPRVRGWAGYATTEERFESGNPELPPGGFRAHHALGGVAVQLLRRTGLELSVDQEWRSNGTSVTTGNASLVQRW